MNNSDKIQVIEDFCVACQGLCKNNDPEDYDHLFVEWDRLIDNWFDRGVSQTAAWAFLATTLMQIAKENGAKWEDIRDNLEFAWHQKDNEEGE